MAARRRQEFLARPMITWLVGALLTAWTPTAQGAQPADTAGPVADAPDAGELWRDAQAKLGTSDYEGAIDSLTSLYELVVHDPEAGALRQRVRWALHQAHLGAYTIEQDAQHLEVALDLVGKYLDALPADDTERRDEAVRARAEIEALMEGHREPEPEPPPEPEPEPAPVVAPPPEPAPPAVAPTPAPPPDDPSARPLLIAGGSLIGIGVVGTGLLIGGLASANAAVGTFETAPADREDARRSIRTGNALGIAGGVIAGAFTVSGAALLGLGLQRRRGSITPTAGRGGGGLVWTGRF